MEKINIHILMGLPASGKTFYRKELEQPYRNNPRKCFTSVDCDYYLGADSQYYGFKKFNTIQDVLQHDLTLKGRCNMYCIDGLITTNNQVQTIIDYCNNDIEKWFYNPEDFQIIVHHWREDRETCLYNDKYRRTHSAEASIRNLPLDRPDNFEFDSKIPVSIEYHTVVKKTMYEGTFLPKSSNTELGIMKSSQWCTGGTCKDCWGGVSECTPQPPVEFTELDTLLEELCPNITFLQYKSITAKCVSIEDDYECDYYGGRRLYSRYICDLKKLYDGLIELGLITENDD